MSGDTKKKRRRKAAERLKNVLIILLLMSAVFFGWASRLFGNTDANADSLARLLSAPDQPVVNSDTPKSNSVAGMPAAVVLTDGSGAHCGIRYDLAGLSLFFNRTVAMFSRALGTAQTPHETSLEDWRQALRSLGVCYEYLSPLSLKVLAGLYSSQISGTWGDAPVRRICLTFSGEKYSLYYQDEETGRFYVSDTYSAETGGTDDITALTAAFPPNSTKFAFEVRAGTRAPYALLMMATADHPALRVSNPLSRKDAAVKDVVQSLGIGGQSKYSDAGGTHYIGSYGNATISNDGTIVYQSTVSDTPGTNGRTDPGEAIRLSYDMISKTVGNTKYCGNDTAVCYSSGSALPGGAYRVLFSYVAAGGVVWLHPDGWAASVTVRNGHIVEAELRFRSYATGDAVTLLPELQAAAAAGGAFALGYDDDGGDGALKPFWNRILPDASDRVT